MQDPVTVTRTTYDVVAGEFRRRTWMTTFDLDAELDWLVDQLPPADSWPGVLAELSRVVRESGPLHLAVSEGDGEAWETGTYGDHPRFFVHHRLGGLAPLLVDAGFTVVHVARYTANRAWLRVRARKQAPAVAS